MCAPLDNDQLLAVMCNGTKLMNHKVNLECINQCLDVVKDTREPETATE